MFLIISVETIDVIVCKLCLDVQKGQGILDAVRHNFKHVSNVKRKEPQRRYANIFSLTAYVAVANTNRNGMKMLATQIKEYKRVLISSSVVINFGVILHQHALKK